MSKLTLVVGASENTERYANKATKMLLEHQHPVYLFGRTAGQVLGQPIHTSLPSSIPSLDSITMYINPDHQQAIMQDLLALKPKRIIFNPGTENPEFVQKAQENGIVVENACTLVLLSTGMF